MYQTKEIPEIKAIEGHIVLLCKGHYSVENVDFLTAIRRIWAIRCGYDYDKEDKSSDRYIANELCKIFKQLNPVKFDYFFERIHSEINNNFRYEDLNSLERLILMYKSEIMMIQIREKQGKEYIDLIKLPIPNKPLFEKIISGNGDYNDYKQF